MIEEELLEGARINIAKLLAYGFQKKNDCYYIEDFLYQNEFKVIIQITPQGIVKGNIIDLSSEEEFLGFRRNPEGSFSHLIKEEYIKLLLKIKNECFDFNEPKNYFVVPANSKIYDVIGHFKNHDTIIWKQKVDVNIGDIVYVYIGVPYSALLFRCEAIRVNMLEKQEKTMELKRLEQYEKELYPLVKLREHGLKNVRCSRKLPEQTVAFLNSTYYDNIVR